MGGAELREASVVLLMLSYFFVSYKQRATGNEVSFSVRGIVEAHGYPCEEYQVTTADGFLLPVQRLPNIGGSPVLIQAGLLDSSASFVMNHRNNSLPFILHDLGYDVFLSNTRALAVGHTHLSKDDPLYFDWSLDQLAAYDLTAIVNFALNSSQASSLAYVGHSQGSMLAFAGLSDNSLVKHELQSKINLLVAMAPVGNFDAKNIMHRFGSAMLNTLLENTYKLCDWIGREHCMRVAPFDFVRQKIFMPNTKWFCGDYGLCGHILTFLAGGEGENFEYDTLARVFDRYPFESSLKNLLHFSQMDSSGLFRKFDYGKEINLKKYGQVEPPLYQVNVGVPTAVYYGDQDLMALPHRSANLVNAINQSYLVDAAVFPGWGHSDFCWGLSKQQLLYPRIVELMNRYALH